MSKLLTWVPMREKVMLHHSPISYPQYTHYFFSLYINVITQRHVLSPFLLLLLPRRVSLYDLVFLYLFLFLEAGRSSRWVNIN